MGQRCCQQAGLQPIKSSSRNSCPAQLHLAPAYQVTVWVAKQAALHAAPSTRCPALLMAGKAPTQGKTMWIWVFGVSSLNTAVAQGKHSWCAALHPSATAAHRHHTAMGGKRGELSKPEWFWVITLKRGKKSLHPAYRMSLQREEQIYRFLLIGEIKH